MNPSKVLITGCSRSVGRHVYDKLCDKVGEVVGIGLGGPDVTVDFNDIDCLTGAEIVLKEALNETVDATVPFDLVIHNAGMTEINKLSEFTDEQWLKVMQVNLNAPFFLNQAWTNHVLAYEADDDAIDYKGSAIEYRSIFVGSMGSKMALRHSYSYCASKAGLMHLVRTLAKSFTPPEPDCFSFFGINPNGIADTAMITQAQSELVRTRGWDDAKAKSYIEGGAPLGRLITHKEVWEALKGVIFYWPKSASGSILDITGAMGI
jgi:NAD(P)-dependent dehydrogenase (short-subunit alcohol dehydrogenase family)